MGQNSDVVSRFWSAFEAGELDSMAELMTPDAVFIQPGMPEVRGSEEMKMMLGGWRAAFPDLRHEEQEVVESGDTVVVQLRVKGTHTGPMRLPDGQEVAPTGREMVWESVDWIKLRDGKLAFWKVYQDTVPFLTALGLLPEPTAAG
jgi:ketosteroid isomerase-like protein